MTPIQFPKIDSVPKEYSSWMEKCGYLYFPYKLPDTTIRKANDK